MTAPSDASEMRQLLSMRDRLLSVIQLQGGSPPSYGSATTPTELQEEIQELLRHAKQSLVTAPQSSQRSNPEGCAASRRLQLALCQNARCVRPATLTQAHVRDFPTDLIFLPRPHTPNRLRRLALRILNVAPHAPELSAEARALIERPDEAASHCHVLDAAAKEVAAHNVMLLRSLRADEAIVRSLHSEMRHLAALCFERHQPEWRAAAQDARADRTPQHFGEELDVLFVKILQENKPHALASMVEEGTNALRAEIRKKLSPEQPIDDSSPADVVASQASSPLTTQLSLYVAAESARTVTKTEKFESLLSLLEQIRRSVNELEARYGREARRKAAAEELRHVRALQDERRQAREREDNPNVDEEWLFVEVSAKGNAER
jgi:hypothetical protein